MPVLAGENGMKTVSVVILTRNRKELLKSCLQSVVAQDFSGLQVVVVDNAGSDGTPTMIKEKFPDVNYIKLKENVGVAGRNRGVEAANGELIITLDDDSRLLRTNTVTRIVEKFRENKNLGAAGFRIVGADRNEYNWFRWPKLGSCRAGYLSPTFLTCGAAIRPEMFERTGGFWKPYFIYVEERDLATRIINSGAAVRYFPDITILHRRENRNRETGRLFYYVTRNSFWYFWRNFDLGTAFWKSFFYFFKQAGKAFLKNKGGRYFVLALIHSANGLREALNSRQPVKTENLTLVEGNYKLLEDSAGQGG